MKDHSLKEIQQLLIDKKISTVEMVKTYLDNIHFSAHLNAYVEIYAEEALAKARETDFKIAQNPTSLGKLFGCVVSVKDMICQKNHQISAASGILKGFESQIDAFAIEQILLEDAIIIGRTNCDEFGMGSANTNSIAGPVKNGADPDRISGGSSGGAAVSLQMYTCQIALGTDTGGSVRQPAAMCGVWGFKPSYGMVSRYGLIAYASSFDQLGILGYNPQDIHTIMKVISVKDHKDATMFQSGLYPEQPGFEESIDFSKIKIAYFKDILDNHKTEPEINSGILDNINELKNLGCYVEEIEFPMMEYLIPCYYILTTAEASSNLSRYDGVRFGHRSLNSDSPDTMYKFSRTEGFGREVKKRIILGSFVLSASYYDAYFTKAQQVRRLLRDQISDIFKKFDFIILPTSPRSAWKTDEKPTDPLEIYLSDIYTVLANLTGVAAVSIPSGKNRLSMPFGIQLYADSKNDKKLLEFCENWKEWHSS
ncbi:MAG: Asp-tRNA(Asn)/Glu-tRNA(Gln) amidotransferase subunit GatA [Saprospiraceae bacterium]|nr:Asp-tRNA(Asn)/Glu-tRNA(Gln) amidotransferase subunit GatA [Saprospiraceae bacterium]